MGRRHRKIYKIGVGDALYVISAPTESFGCEDYSPLTPRESIECWNVQTLDCHSVPTCQTRIVLQSRCSDCGRPHATILALAPHHPAVIRLRAPGRDPLHAAPDRGHLADDPAVRGAQDRRAGDHPGPAQHDFLRLSPGRRGDRRRAVLLPHPAGPKVAAVVGHRAGAVGRGRAAGGDELRGVQLCAQVRGAAGLRLDERVGGGCTSSSRWRAWTPCWWPRRTPARPAGCGGG